MASTRVPGSRNQMLDALRGVAILLVLGRHLPVFPIWARIGWSGVDLFFVLSGYLVSGLLFRDWLSTGRLNLPRFLIRRGLKIYPAFFAMLFITLAVAHFYPGFTPYPITRSSILAEVTFMQSYFQNIWGLTWSLSVEEHFYLLLALALWLMWKRKPSGQNLSQNTSPAPSQNPFHWLPQAFLCVAALELLLRFVFGWHLTSVDDYPRFGFRTHLRLDSLFFGVLLSYLRHFHENKFEELRRGAAPWLFFGIALIFLIVLPFESPVMHTLGFTVLYFGFGLLLIKVVDKQLPVILRPIAIIGYYSYSIYLWHGWIADLLPHVTVRQFTLGLFASVALGIVMAKLIEYPVLSLRDRMFPAMSGAPTLTPPSANETAHPGGSMGLQPSEKPAEF